jgi:hypothetical protein
MSGKGSLCYIDEDDWRVLIIEEKKNFPHFIAVVLSDEFRLRYKRAVDEFVACQEVIRQAIPPHV